MDDEQQDQTDQAAGVKPGHKRIRLRVEFPAVLFAPEFVGEVQPDEVISGDLARE